MINSYVAEIIINLCQLSIIDLQTYLLKAYIKN